MSRLDNRMTPKTNLGNYTPEKYEDNETNELRDKIMKKQNEYNAAATPKRRPPSDKGLSR